MLALAVAGIVLGQLALVLDLGNRLFGSYVRSAVGTTARIVLIVASAALLALPLFVLAVDYSSTAGHVLLYVCGCIGFLALVHFLFPYRSGIRKAKELNDETSTTALAGGVVLRHSVLEVPALPDGLEVLRLLVISDLHCNSQAKLTLVRETLQGLCDQQADLVFVLGDFGEEAPILPEVVEALNDVPSRFGTFCIRGNHDFEGGREAILEELLAESSMTLLSNEAHSLRQLRVTLVGVERPWKRTPVPVETTSGFVIGLSHTPDNFRLLVRLGVDIVFAGHTHGGGLRLPVVGALLVPCRYGRFLDKGWFALKHCLMYVTLGFGYFSWGERDAAEVFHLTLTAKQ